MTAVWTFEVSDRDDHAYVTTLGDAERAVLVDAIDAVLDLLGAGTDSTGGTGATDDVADRSHPLDRLRLGRELVPAPQDPTLLRLLPDGYRDDAEVAAEFRRLTQDDLLATKSANLRRMRASLSAGGPDVAVTREHAPQVAAALTDLRLVVADRLGIGTDEESDAILTEIGHDGAPPPADGALAVQRFLVTVYAMLGMLQGSLVTLMLADLPDEPEGRR